MPTRSTDIEIYENQGALLQIGSSQILSFSDFATPQTATLSYGDSAPTNRAWDFGENATLDDSPVTLVATGTASAGLQVNLLGLLPIDIQLSSAVQVAVLSSAGQQYLRFYNPDGTDADPAALLDELASALVDQLNSSLIPPLLRPVVDAILINPLEFVQTNALLSFNLSDAAGLPTVPCFTAGTMLMTRDGERPAGALRVGDEVLTVDRGFRPIRWIGRRTLRAVDFLLAPHLRPIRIDAGALGFGLPFRALVVSPQHRCLLRSTMAARVTGSQEVLVAAKHLTDLPGIGVMERPGDITYVHILLDRHELLFSDGAITESFYLGPQAVAALDQPARDELQELFPDLAERLPNETPDRARSFVSGHIAREMVARSLKNSKLPVQRAYHECH